jgi:hypothetical protein
MSKELQTVEPKSEVAIIFENINSGLAAFENRKAELIALKSKADGLEIKSIDDREAIKQVSTIRKEFKNARVDIQKEAKSMRDPLTKVNKSISEKEKELVDIIEPTEKELMAKEKWVENEKERIELEEKRKEEERIQQRIDRLAEYGHGVDIFYLKSLDDDRFEVVVNNAKAEWEKDQAAKAEEARLQKEKDEQAEKDRLELQAMREKQAEADRILRERQEEIERKELEMKQREEDERLLSAKKLEKEMKDARFEPRKEQLLKMGFATYGISGYPDFSLEDTWSTQWEQVYEMADAEWPEYIKDIENAIERRKVRLAEEEKKRLAELEEARQRGIREAKEAADRKATEEAERLAQASDKDKFQTIIDQLEAINYPEMKSAKHKKLLAEVKDLNAKVIAHIKTKA